PVPRSTARLLGTPIRRDGPARHGCCSVHQTGRTPFGQQTQRMRFVIVSKWFTGLGFALRLQDEGHDVELAVVGIDDQRMQSRYARVGDGLVAKRALADVMGTRERLRDAYFIWDENHSVAEN